METKNTVKKNGSNPILPSELDKNNNSVSFSSSKLPNQLSGVISGASSILNTAIDLGSINDNYDDDIEQVEDQAFSPSSTYSLMNQFNNINWGSNKTLQDFTGKTGKDYAKGILGATASGAAAGATFGPWGALIGGAVGLVGSGIGAAVGHIRGSDALDRYRDDLADARTFAMNNWNTANTSLKTNMFDNSVKSFYRSSAYGGNLDTAGSDFTNGVKYINAGGTHEQNPFGGVPMGVDQEGTPNLVEEGEVIVNDYVFSDRMKPSKSALEKSYLDPKLYGFTYAEIAEKLAEGSEEMANDSIEKRTLSVNISRLMGVQEEARARKANSEANKFDSGGRLTEYEYNRIIKGYEQQAKRYASKLAANDILYQELYNKKLAELREEIDKKWAEQQKLDKEYNERFDKENREAERKVNELIAAGFLIPKIPAGMTGAERINYAKVNEMYNEFLGDTINNQEETKTENPKLENIKVEEENPKESKQEEISKQEQKQQQKPSGYIDNTGKFIPYSRNTKQEGIDFENQQYYQDFLKYMQDPENREFAQQWIDSINAENFGPMGGYKIKDFDDWLRLATDKKIGPVHNATLNAANNWANTEMARRSMNAIEPIKLNTQVQGPGAELRGPASNPTKYQETLAGVGEEPKEPANDEGNPDEEFDWSSLLRYAPVLGNAVALLGNRKDYSDVRRFEQMTANPRTVRFTPIGTYIRPNLVAPSEMSTPIENQMSAERNYIRNNSLGNSTVSNNYTLASDYLGNAKIGAAYLQGKQYNADQRQRAAAYNLGIDQYNSEGAFREQQQNMTLNDYYLRRALSSYQMKNNIDMAYNQARSSNLTAMFNNLGNIGLDTFNRNRANEVYPYKYNGYAGDIDYFI